MRRTPRNALLNGGQDRRGWRKLVIARDLHRPLERPVDARRRPPCRHLRTSFIPTSTLQCTRLAATNPSSNDQDSSPRNSSTSTKLDNMRVCVSHSSDVGTVTLKNNVPVGTALPLPRASERRRAVHGYTTTCMQSVPNQIGKCTKTRPLSESSRPWLAPRSRGTTAFKLSAAPSAARALGDGRHCRRSSDRAQHT